jgi:multidrug efflux pump subunit AcrA (membrane-fusion protein)
VATSLAPQRPTYVVERGDVSFQIGLSGRVAALVEEPLAFTVDGQVGEVFAGRDSLVRAGDRLAALDTQAVEAELAQARSALAIAQRRLETVQTEVAIERRRAEIAVEMAQLDLDFSLSAAGETPTPEQAYQIGRLELQLELAQLELDRLTATIDPALQADADAAGLRVTELESHLAQSILIAPIDGRILSFNLVPGRSVAAGDVVGLMADPAELEVSANANGDQLEQLTVDMAALISPISGRGGTYPAVIRELPVRVDGSNQSDAELRIAFANEADAAVFELGQRVSIDILVAEHHNVLWLPPAAIRDFNGRKFVVIQDGELQRRSDLTLGLVGPERVEIVAGVEAGEVVIGP